MGLLLWLCRGYKGILLAWLFLSDLCVKKKKPGKPHPSFRNLAARHKRSFKPLEEPVCLIPAKIPYPEAKDTVDAIRGKSTKKTLNPEPVHHAC